MAARFDKFYPQLSDLEGAYQNSKSDPGNRNSLGVYVGTNYGISARFYEAVKGYPPTVADMKNLTKAEARELYKEHFWYGIKANKINSQIVANNIADMHVNSGQGVKIAQRVLRDEFNKAIAVDNVMGPNTLNALNSVNEFDFNDAYNNARIDYYISLGNKEWLQIWLNRVKRFAVDNSATISMFSVLLITGIGLLIYKNLAS